MESRAKLFGHPIHQMLIVFPLGLLATAVIFDAISFFSGVVRWTEAAFYMIGAGVVSGLIAAIFGAIDYFAIPDRTRAKRIGWLHGVGNVVVVLFFAASWWLRWNSPADPGTFAYLCSYLGAVLALFTGWLGGELVDAWVSEWIAERIWTRQARSLPPRPAIRFRLSSYAGICLLVRRTSPCGGICRRSIVLGQKIPARSGTKHRDGVSAGLCYCSI